MYIVPFLLNSVYLLIHSLRQSRLDSSFYIKFSSNRHKLVLFLDSVDGAVETPQQQQVAGSIMYRLPDLRQRGCICDLKT